MTQFGPQDLHLTSVCTNASPVMGGGSAEILVQKKSCLE